jgi:O-acetyl-ADP-ribose deacetylase (regulator of RNase III)/ADP-ribose pyrophosphatase YjhB (NUDIX family)
MDKEIFFINGVKIEVKTGDITEEKTDAIVNAANNHLIMGGGVAGAIRKKGGKEIEEEAIKKGPIPIGEAIITKAGSLSCNYVIHAATMGMDFITNEEKIRNSTKNSLIRARELKIDSISFPALGCGVGGFNIEQAAKIMIDEIWSHLMEKTTIKKISFVLFNKDDYKKFIESAEIYLINLSKKTFRNPIPTVDIIIETEKGILLIKRKNPPYGWAIPGGFVDYEESLENAAIREAKEETNIDIIDLKQFHTYSKPGRDPRFHTISTVFTAKATGIPKAGDDADKIGIYTQQNLPDDIAFDHRDILSEYFRSL